MICISQDSYVRKEATTIDRYDVIPLHHCLVCSMMFRRIAYVRIYYMETE
jgi:hypothetical protein